MGEVAIQTSDNAHKTWAQAAGLPETSTRLERLPEGMNFPDDFPEPIRFDPARKRLTYRGFMTSLSYRFLHTLSTDGAYIAALDELFEESAYALDRRSGLAAIWPWLVGASALLGTLALVWIRLR
jgi:hypothetical protein